jgi:AraC-like DNA-binding protein
MIQFEYDHTDYHAWLRAFSRKLGVEMHHDTIDIPAAFGEGFIRAVRLPNGLSACISQNTMHTGLLLKRVRKEPCYYILGFDEITIPQKLEQVVGGEREEMRPPVYAGASLSSTLIDNLLIASRGCSTRTIKLMFPASWLARYFGIEKEDELLAEYLSYKTRKLTLEPLDLEYRKLMDEAFAVRADDPLYYTILENRMMLMMERFFSRLSANVKEAKFKRLEKSDIYKMMQVESELASDDNALPPTSLRLAEKHGFSETRLKRLFREIYGFPIYEYYQRCRLERAREILLSGRYSVKEAGMMVGYKSLSNFSKAFRHIYGQLPGEMIDARL